MIRRLSLGLATALCAAGAAVFAGEDEAPKGSLAFVHIDYVKPAMVMEYEQATKEMIDTLDSYQIDPKKTNFHAIAGPTLGYVYVMPIENFAGIDAMQENWMDIAEKIGEERWEAMFAKVDKCVDRHETIVSRHRPDLSYVPEEPDVAQEDVKFLGYTFYHVQPGHTQEFEAIAKEYIALHEELDSGFGWQIYQSVIAKDRPTYLVIHGAKSPSDYYARLDKMDKLIGERGHELGQKAMSHLRSMEREQGWLRPDLSYPTPQGELSSSTTRD